MRMGLWEGHDIMEVASPEGFARNPELVLDFYNQRRKQLLTVAPNAGHKALVSLEELYEVSIITQNVDLICMNAPVVVILYTYMESC